MKDMHTRQMVAARSFAYGNYVDEVLIMSVNGSPVYSYFKYYVHDHLYSPVALTNSAGSVEERYEYDGVVPLVAEIRPAAG